MAWFRELPTGVLDSLSSEQVMQCESEEDCTSLVRLLPPTEAALLDWAINLMADIVQEEHSNKMNARNIAMVFAPNMTQMADPLTALMYAVQVMNFLRTLIEKTLRERQDLVVELAPVSQPEPSDENEHQSPSLHCPKDAAEENECSEQAFAAEEPHLESASESYRMDSGSDDEFLSYSTFPEESYEGGSCAVHAVTDGTELGVVNGPQTKVTMNMDGSKLGQSSDADDKTDDKKSPGKTNELQPAVLAVVPVDKSKGISNLSLINSRIDLLEAWR